MRFCILVFASLNWLASLATANELPDTASVASATDRLACATNPDARHQAELEEMIGQMILVGFLGDNNEHAWFSSITEQLKSGKITGVLYLRRNISDRASVDGMNTALNTAGRNRPMPLIGVDQEGGRIERLTEDIGFPHTPSASSMASESSVDQAHEAYGELARNLRELGFNFNLAPVVDLNINADNPIISRFDRSFSSDPETVIQYGTAFVDAHRAEGVVTALKHFPGHGSSTDDSHYGAVDVSDSWSEAELTPFSALIANGRADMIMSAHIRNLQIQDREENLPVSLSPSGLKGTLRNKMGYTGVIISDDMQMGAIRDNYTLNDAVIRAVEAGNDILIFANDRYPVVDIPDQVISILSEAAGKDRALAAGICESYRRIIALKSRLETVPGEMAE